MVKSVESEQLFTGYSGRLFFTVSAGWLFIQMGRQLIPPLLPNIIDDLAITSVQAGFALTMMGGLYALCQYPSGRLSDRLSRKTILATGLALLIVGFTVVQGTEFYSSFLIGVGIVGLGAGVYPTAARALLSDHFVDRRGQAFGLHTSSGDLGNAAAAGLAVVALSVATWQMAFLPVIVLLAGTLLAFHFWSHESYVLETVDLGIRSTGRRLFKKPRLRRLLVVYALYAFTWQSTVGFLPTFLQVEKEFSVGLASSGFAFLFIIGALVKPASGFLGDQFGRVNVAVGALILGVGGLVGVLNAESTLLIFLAIGVFAAGLMSFPPVMQALLMDIFPNRSMGGDLGAMRSFYIGFGSLGPTYVGYVADLQSYTLSFIGLVVCLLLSAGIVTSFELLQ